MVSSKESRCTCGGELRRYDSVNRIVKGKYGICTSVKICRMQCRTCGSVRRVLPDDILPFKQYSAEIILGVLERLITSDTLGFEEYPCEATMERWLSTGVILTESGSYPRITFERR